MNRINRIFTMVITGALISACNASPEKPSAETRCKDPRPQMCTMIYQPVCGLDEGGQWKTYSSGCNACSHPEVVGYNQDACNAPEVKKGQ